MNPSQLSTDDINQYTSYFNVETGNHKTDLAFLFGGHYSEPAFIAASLFKEDQVPYIVVTGGVNRLTGMNEARTHQALLLAVGIPFDRIIVEDESTNTYENVIFAIPKIKRVIEITEIKSVTIVTKWYHARRAMMTLKPYFPPLTRLFAKTYAPEGIPWLDWQLYETSVIRVLKELERIPRYQESGHIVEIQRDGDAYI